LRVERKTTRHRGGVLAEVCLYQRFVLAVAPLGRVTYLLTAPEPLNSQPATQRPALRFSIKSNRLDSAAEVLESIDSTLSAAPWIADEIIEPFLAANDYEVGDAIRIA
jgi:hypothetical protein